MFGLEVRGFGVWFLVIEGSKVRVVWCCCWWCVVIDIVYVSVGVVGEYIEVILVGFLIFWCREG